MDRNNILHADLLDIIFDQRNKTYGAYELRRTYPQRLKRSLLAGLSFVSLVLLFPVLATLNPESSNATTLPKRDVVTELDELIIPTPPVTPPSDPVTASSSHDQIATIVNPILEIVPTETAPTEPLPNPEDLKDHASGATDQDGIKPDDSGLGGGGLSPGGFGETPSTSGIPAVIPEDNAVYTPEDNIDQLPSFPGGEDAMIRFIRDHINYPKMARENGVEGKVVVSFIVDKQGNLSSLKIIRGTGSGLNEEALRVVDGMPQWKPGSMNGHPVKVELYLPLEFQLNQD